ncbi:DUF3108 domain-containing protein [Oceanicella actignis]|uniref:DUF3108 domain-containing protein n=1 Tax=Oceanicella actignis TaxID=1189325 RepID=UPI0011E712BB|nr:DUF3108 domain-containing protein [Oceanicella actignis]TYO89160.1 uncharacterized protein DUF3108 [Oceanicella actignis]
MTRRPSNPVRRHAAALAAAALAIAAPAPHAAPAAAAPEASVAARFDVHFGGIRAGEVSVTLSEDGRRYSIVSRAVTAGIVGAFYDAAYDAQAQGALAPAPKPEAFRAVGDFGGKRQQVEIAFGPLAPREVKADPPFKPKPYEIDPAVQIGVLDPLSAAATVLRPAPIANICPRSLDIFDGRRRAQITLGPPTRRDSGELRCHGRFKRVAGYRPKDMKSPDIAFSLDFEDQPTGAARLRRVTVDTGWGLLVALRRD